MDRKNRGAEVLTEVESKRLDTILVDKNVGSKVIWVGAHRAFYTLAGNLRATCWAACRYAPEELEMICEYASAH